MPRHAPLLGLFLALLGLSGLTPSASAQGLLPQFSIEASGACRQLSVRDRDGKTQAPLGCLSSGKWTLQPERLQILGPGSTGDVSAMSIGGTTLPNLLGQKAPLANPTFSGTATVPALNLTGAGSTGDGSAFSVTPKDSATPRALSALLSGLPINALGRVDSPGSRGVGGMIQGCLWEDNLERSGSLGSQ